ncbi:MAG: hypothetical protein Q9188_000357 [Gyalolechia gomerana]
MLTCALGHSFKVTNASQIVEGDWKDSKDRVINLEEWEEQTVERVLECLYSGFYTMHSAPGPASKTTKAPETGVDHRRPITWQQLCNSRLASPLPGDINEGDCAFQHEPDCVPNQYRPLTRLLDIRCPGSPRSPTSQSSPAKDGRPILSGSLPRADWGHTLLPDAKVYVLAQYLQLIDLKRYAFRHVQDVLGFLNQPTPDLAALIRTLTLTRFIYSSTDSLTNFEEPLRNLVSTFVAEWFLKIR